MSSVILAVHKCWIGRFRGVQASQETTDFQARKIIAEPAATTMIPVTCDFQSSMRRRLNRISFSRRAAAVEIRSENSTSV